MLETLGSEAQQRLEGYFDEIGAILRHRKKRANFAVYALGLMGSAERKSCEPIAVQFCESDAGADAAHQRLLHFVTDSEWDDRPVRRAAARYAIAALSERSPVKAWIIDDTGFMKQGRHSVGVQRQYTGTAGKIANCQIGVSLVAATDDAHIPIDFDLYLPESWANDPKKRAEAKIPESVKFRTKPEIALELIERAALDRLPGEIVLADSAYGDSHEFREGVRLMNFDYAVGIHATTKVWMLDASGRRRGDAMSGRDVGVELGLERFRRVTWREGTGKSLHSRFAFQRVKVAHDDGTEPSEREAVWLVIEWPEGEDAPTKFSLTTLAKTLSKKQIVRLLKERYRTERAYEEMKGELGLDHFEGRRYRGWHHHVTAVIACYAFIAAERVRAFPPSADGPSDDDEIDTAA